MIGNDVNAFLWSERSRPKKVADLVLPERLKKTFQQFVDQKEIPNLLLCGGGGVGKTSAALALCKEIESDYILINTSLNGNIDALRNDIQNFASSVSFSGGRKVIILDEIDYSNSNSFQPALRNFMESFSSNCGFILTCNFPGRIIAPLHSRCTVIDFKLNKDEKENLAILFFGKVAKFLQTEKIEFEPKAVQAVIVKHFPDYRRIWNELQRYSAAGKIDTGILVDFSEESFKSLVGYLKKKDFTNVRKWVAEQGDKDSSYLFRKLYDSASSCLVPTSIPQLILHLAKYQDMATRAADMEILLAACLLEVMVDCEFKQ